MHRPPRRTISPDGENQFSCYAGKAELSFVDGLGIELLVDVVSTKIGYETEFQKLLEQLADIHAEIILNMDGATEVVLRENLDQAASDQMQIFHLRRLFRESCLPQSMAAILSQPHFKYRNHRKTNPLAFVTDPDLVEMAANPADCQWQPDGPLAAVFRGFTPELMPAHTIERTYDTIENRFVKTSLRLLHARIASLDLRIPEKYAATHVALARWSRELEEILQNPLWENVGYTDSLPNSMTLQRRHGYRDFVRNILVFDFGLLLNTTVGEYDPTSGDLKPVHDLYELWCYFQLRKAIEATCKSEGRPTLSHIITEKDYRVDLKKGTGSAVKYPCTYSEVPVVVNLYYNRNFWRIDSSSKNWTESYSTLFHPDFSIEIRCKEMTHWVHFDAKYRLDITKWRAALDANDKETHAYKGEDLHTMHGYRDALLGTRGSFILYPGQAQPEIFVRHIDSQYRDSNPGPGVGAFGLILVMMVRQIYHN